MNKLYKIVAICVLLTIFQSHSTIDLLNCLVFFFLIKTSCLGPHTKTSQSNFFSNSNFGNLETSFGDKFFDTINYLLLKLNEKSEFLTSCIEILAKSQREYQFVFLDCLQKLIAFHFILPVCALNHRNFPYQKSHYCYEST